MEYRDTAKRKLAIMVLTMLVTGTTFYSLVENWSVLDALYFSVVTLTTVGFGDLTPTRPISKAFTIIYILVGVGLLTAFIRIVVRQAVPPDKSSTAPNKTVTRQKLRRAMYRR
ncbi:MULTISPECIES: potassium channel family protein [unclassified Microbulbifer]|uniref:potassium channel family protein n=1 Tax=unclassified Microbulbifer TaxID=2619833 RepID=UPI0027E5B534|nr:MULTISPECIES: potassium channel family protein [unclassified Microbulbifer]